MEEYYVSIEKHSSMLNVTARLGVKVANLPTWEVYWSDTKPQCSRSDLGYEDFLPSVDDSIALNEAAIQYTMEFLVEEFACLKNLKCLVPSRQSPHPVKRPAVAPMPILFRDEKYTADANLTGNPQVRVCALLL